ncbi:MAG: hypothetical protein PHH55_05505 [Candidatus Delongbacteria bacterium]|nr:hypothetical protein [Candidatus Delongbacteria bacterium]
MGKEMKNNKKLPDNQITVYETSDGKINCLHLNCQLFILHIKEQKDPIS